MRFENNNILTFKREKCFPFNEIYTESPIYFIALPILKHLLYLFSTIAIIRGKITSDEVQNPLV